MVSATDYDDLRKRHGLEWDKAKYAAAHILFFGENGDVGYLKTIFGG